jgi:hypothetical protein
MRLGVLAHARDVNQHHGLAARRPGIVPGRQHRDFARPEFGLPAVIHHHMQPPGNVVLQVRRLTARRARRPRPWSTQSCVPHRQSCRSSAFLSCCIAGCSCGAGFPACGRLSSRPWPPSPTALCSAQSPSPPSGACRQACHAGGRAGRAVHSPPARGFPTPSAAKTGGVARQTVQSTSRAGCSCGAGFSACGRLSSRPWPPSPTTLSSAQPRAL